MSTEPSAITIRRARTSDSAVLAELSRELGYPASRAELSERLQSLLENQSHAVYVAETEAEVVGWVHVYCYAVLESAPRAEIGGLITAPAFRRRGVGKLLMERAENWAREAGLASVSLRSNVTRVASHLFFEQLGYTKTKTQFSFRRHL